VQHDGMATWEMEVVCHIGGPLKLLLNNSLGVPD